MNSHRHDPRHLLGVIGRGNKEVVGVMARPKSSKSFRIWAGDKAVRSLPPLEV